MKPGDCGLTVFRPSVSVKNGVGESQTRRSPLDIKITGLDALTKTLEDAQRAIESIDGELATLRIDPNNPQAAISEMERLVDAKLARYRGNAIVDQISEKSKEAFRKAILEKAEEAKRNSTDEE
jgi:hypothetical protein